MRGQPPANGPRQPGSDSYFRALFNLLSILAAVVVIAVVMQTGRRPARLAPIPITTHAAPAAPLAALAAPAAGSRRAGGRVASRPRVASARPRGGGGGRGGARRGKPRPCPRRGAARRGGAVARGDERRGGGGGRAAAASWRIGFATPSAQLTRITKQGGFVRAERDRLKEEVAALCARHLGPRSKSIVDRNPVAKPAGGEEYHFEVRRNRVTFIDLERLLKLVKADAQLRVRLAENSRVIESRVGPVGSFSMDYVLSRSPLGVEDLIERRGYSFDLRGWELIPEYEGRGEPYEATLAAVLRIRPHDQSPQHRALHDHHVGLPRRLRPLPQAPRRPSRARLPRRRPPAARGNAHQGEPRRLALGGAMTRVLAPHPHNVPPDGRILLVPTLPRGNAVGDAPRRLGLRSAIKQVPQVSLAEGFDDRSCRIRLEIVGLFRQAL